MEAQQAKQANQGNYTYLNSYACPPLFTTATAFVLMVTNPGIGCFFQPQLKERKN
jgi:hypothetical protein